MKSSNEDENPLIISMGNKISNQMALKIVKKMCKSRIPEPIRIADLITRRLIKARKKYGTKNQIWNWNLKDYLKENNDYLHKNLDQCIDDEKEIQNENIQKYNFRGKGEGPNFKGNFRGRGRGIRGRFRKNFGRTRIDEEKDKDMHENKSKEEMKEGDSLNNDKDNFEWRRRELFRGEQNNLRNCYKS